MARDQKPWEKPWIVQQERRVLVRGRATAELQDADGKPKARTPKPPPAHPVDRVNQD